jgi:selenocysteine lyase/cysteine desulfurase
MLTCQRNLFDIPDDVTYLNSAYMGPMPISIQQASQAALQLRIQPWNLQPSDFFDPGEHARSKIGQLLNASTEQICFVPNVSNAMGLLERHLARAWTNGSQPRSKRKIVVLGEQFPSNVFPWHNLRTLGFEILTIPAPSVTQAFDGNVANERVKLWNQALLNAIDENTALVGIEPAHWTDGTAFDLEKIAKKCHANKAFLAIDGTQTIGIEAIDLQVLKPAVYVAHPYKSMLCNYGLAFAYLDSVLMNSQPLEEHWLMRHNAQDFTRLTDYQSQYAEGARRFDSSNRANPAMIMMLIASLELFEQWQQPRIAQYLRSISATFCETMQQAGYAIADSSLRCANIIGLRPPAGTDSQHIAAQLRAQKIYVSVRSGTIRISPHMYNDTNDLKKLSDQLLMMA